MRGADQVPEQPRDGVAALHHVHDRPGATNASPTTRCGHPSVITVTVASEAANVASRTQVDARNGSRIRRPRATAAPGDGEGVSFVTGPVSLRMVTIVYSIGRVAIPRGSRPASTQPMSTAATGMAITMKNRLFHGT